MTNSSDSFTPDDAVRDEVDAPAFDPGLDALLRDWHAENRSAAQARRDSIVRDMARSAPRRVNPLVMVRRSVFAPMTRAAAAILLVGVIAALLLPRSGTSAMAMCDVIFVPEGGRLDARDVRGLIIGTCPLTHTDVDVNIEGRFGRVTLTQTYVNPYDEAIEAIYTFPMSHRGAVDRMSMTIGDRVVLGTVKERREARQIYESARQAGHTAALLEQERPNIFTQSVANVEAGATIEVEISYVETVAVRDGLFEFVFPMTVAPRYIPGQAAGSAVGLPMALEPRRGVVLRGPGQITLAPMPNANAEAEASANANEDQPAMNAARLHDLLLRARPIGAPSTPWWGDDKTAPQEAPQHVFSIQYERGGLEMGVLYPDGTGQINGRWFYLDPAQVIDRVSGFSGPTDQVPDAHRITPSPVPPGVRAGHDVSLSLSIDSGEAGIGHVESVHHEVTGTEPLTRLGQAPRTLDLALHEGNTIPNRDFVLRWRLASDDVTEAVFAHHAAPGTYQNHDGGFATIMIEPPARVEDTDLLPREIVFVIDSSGSMSGFPIEKAKALLALAIDRLRPADTFNVVSFNNSADALFDAARPASDSNRAAALAYVESRHGGGGTEMLNAVHLALNRSRPSDDGPAVLSAREVLDLPADGRALHVRMPEGAGALGQNTHVIVPVSPSHSLALQLPTIESVGELREGTTLRGHWTTIDGGRRFVVESIMPVDRPVVSPTRYVLFVTDGEIGNDDAVVSVVRNGNASCRFFTIGIGSAPNRSLLDRMAVAGRGAADYLALEENATAVLDRFVTRIDRPVLTDIEIELSPELQLVDAVPPLDAIPDLFDESPLTIHARYPAPAQGTLTVRGRRAGMPYERTIDVVLTGPESNTERAAITPTLWARAQVDQHLRRDDRPAVIGLGTTFQILTQYTSFVAVERSRIVVDGEPRLVRVPIELPYGQSYSGTFGGSDPTFKARTQELDVYLGLSAPSWTGGPATLGVHALGYQGQLGRTNKPSGAIAGEDLRTDTMYLGQPVEALKDLAGASAPDILGGIDRKSFVGASSPAADAGLGELSMMQPAQAGRTVQIDDQFGTLFGVAGHNSAQPDLMLSLQPDPTLYSLGSSSMVNTIMPGDMPTTPTLDLFHVTVDVDTATDGSLELLTETLGESLADITRTREPVRRGRAINAPDPNAAPPAGGGGAGSGGGGGGNVPVPASDRSQVMLRDALVEMTPQLGAVVRFEASLPEPGSDAADAVDEMLTRQITPIADDADAPHPLDQIIAELADPTLTWWRAYDAYVIGTIEERNQRARYHVTDGRLRSYHATLLGIVAAMDQTSIDVIATALEQLRSAGGQGPLFDRVTALIEVARKTGEVPAPEARDACAAAIREHMMTITHTARLEAHLRRVIAPALWDAAFRDVAPESALASVHVTILLEAVTDERVEALRTAGARDLAVSTGQALVVAHVNADRLLTVAATPGVRRIERFTAE